MKLEDIFDAIEDIRDKASVNTVFGEPVAAGDKTIIPIASIKYGFGFGYGEGPTEDEGEGETEPHGQGGGVGGGVAAHPVAVLEITDEGVVVKPVTDDSKIALAGMFTGAWAILWLAKIIIAIFGKKK